MVKPFLVNARIFIIDDGLANVQLLRRMLERNGYANVAGTTEPGAVLKRRVDDQPETWCSSTSTRLSSTDSPYWSASLSLTDYLR